MSGSFLLSLCIANLALAATILVTIVVAAPRRIRRAVIGNCYHRDHTFSSRRFHCETRHTVGFLGNALFLITLAILAVNSILLSIHYFVIPLPIAASAALRINVDPNDWKANLDDPDNGSLRNKYGRWAEEQGYRASSTAALRRSLWQAWPLLAAGIVATIWFGASFLLRSLLGLVNEFRDRISERQWQYYLTDNARAASLERRPQKRP